MQEWEAMKRRREIIEVFESPPPTKRATTPRTRTSMRAQRAGASRVRKHKRAYTKWFDPKRQGHCAYEAVIKAAGVEVTLDAIRALRLATAKMVELAVLNDEIIAGISVRDLVIKEGLTLAAYKAQVEGDMWASPVEAACAATVMGVSLYHVYKNVCMKIGHGPCAGVIRLANKHYVLHKLHRQVKEKGDMAYSRGGMRQGDSWTQWQDLDMDQRRRAIMTTPLVYAFDISPAQAPGARLIIRREDTVGAMRVATSMALGVPTSSIHIMETVDEEEPLPDWVQPPNQMTLRRVTQTPMHFRLMGTECIFSIHPLPTWTHADVENRISIILNVLPHFLDFMREDEPWNYDHGPRHGEIVVRTPERGGMRRNISPTMPFTGQQGSGSSSASITPHRDGGVRARSSRSRPRDTQRIRQGNPCPEYWSHALPTSPPPAQDDYVRRPAREGQSRIGVICALPDIMPQAVMRDLRDNLNLDYLPRFYPREAISWMHVDHIELEPQPDLNVVYEDLRATVWERYQQPRVMAVILDGRSIGTVVLPESLPMEDAQNRVNHWHRDEETIDVVRALNQDSWIVHRERVPAYLRAALRELHNIESIYERGGARRSSTEVPIEEIIMPPPYRPPTITQINFQTPDIGYFIWTILAHSPDMPLWITPTARTWELRQYLAVYYDTEPGDILLSTMTRPLHIGEDIKHVPGKVVVVHLLRHQGEPGYFSPFIIPWRANIRYTICTDSQMESFPRGGGKSSGPDVHDPRTAMMTFALDRLQKEYPDLPTATAKFLLPAEARTLTSVLNARNPGQIRQVIDAALKRAEIPKRAQTQEQGATNEDFMLLMQQQAAMISNMFAMIQSQPTAEQWQTVMNAMFGAIGKQRIEIEHLKKKVEDQHEMMLRWERDYFPNGQVVRPAPPPTPTEPGDQDMEEGDSQMQDEQQRTPKRWSRCPQLSQHLPKKHILHLLRSSTA